MFELSIPTMESGQGPGPCPDWPNRGLQAQTATRYRAPTFTLVPPPSHIPLHIQSPLPQEGKTPLQVATTNGRTNAVDALTAAKEKVRGAEERDGQS
jgi:hypothetical protein